MKQTDCNTSAALIEMSASLFDESSLFSGKYDDKIRVGGTIKSSITNVLYCKFSR